MWAAIVAACLALAVSGVAADYSGDGTYYGDNGWEGYCKGNVLSKGGRWPPSNWNGLKVAMNKAQLLNGKAWGNTEMCGKLVTIRGTGGGSGGSPISGNWETAMITNMCPECHYGSIDFGRNGDGRWNIQWKWGSSGGGANHVESSSSSRALIPKRKPAPKPAPKKKKKCNLACKRRNIRNALIKLRKRIAAARLRAKKIAMAKRYNARLRAARLAQRGRKLLAHSA